MSEKFEFGLRIPTSIMIQLKLWFHAMHRIKLELVKMSDNSNSNNF